MALKYGDDLDEAEAAEIMAMIEADDSREDGTARDEPLTADPDPGYPRESLGDRILGDDPGPVRVTQAIRRDIRSKTAMLLTIGAATWADRDPLCGGALLRAIPDQAVVDEDSGQMQAVSGIATSLADIFCDSPDVVRWFTSGGQFVKWLTLASSLSPVLSMVGRHHITHTVTGDQDEDEDWEGVGAG